MKTVLALYGHSVWQKIYEKPERKKRSESRDIYENDIVQWHGETFGIFRRLAAEWRRQAFVYDVIGNMAMATSNIRLDFHYSSVSLCHKTTTQEGRIVSFSKKLFIIIIKFSKFMKLYCKI